MTRFRNAVRILVQFFLKPSCRDGEDSFECFLSSKTGVGGNQCLGRKYRFHYLDHLVRQSTGLLHERLKFDLHGSVYIANVFPSTTNKTQRYIIYLFQ